MSESADESPSTSEVNITQHNCPFCDEVISVRAKKCKHCGETLDVALRQAQEAMRASDRSGNVYMNAAASSTTATVQPYSRTKSRIAAFILAWVLGGIGGHKFYLGQAGQGILYLLFCWTFIPGIIAFVEGIIYLTMSDERFWQKYG
jgi:TM2 domain-containing membrane protein YozV